MSLCMDTELRMEEWRDPRCHKFDNFIEFMDQPPPIYAYKIVIQKL